MEQYVIDCKKYTNLESAMRDCFQYAKLLQSKPTLGMFVPCDENGKVLEEPTEDESWWNFQDDEAKYIDACSKVIFDGWSVYVVSENFTSINDIDANIIDFYNNNEIFCNGNVITTLSDLTKYNLKLK